jgi:hypothetical protein
VILNPKGEGSIPKRVCLHFFHLFHHKSTLNFTESQKTALRLCLQSTAGQLRTILKLVLEIPISKNNFVISGSFQYLNLISMIHFNVTLAVWFGSYFGSFGFKKNPPNNPAPPL